jgi:uncharacterized membrane protein YidH (DUF202 family)
MKQHLPNANAVLILGILSIISCCFCGIGMLFSVVALALAYSDMKRYNEAPDKYTNYPNLNIGRILAIIGILPNLFCIAYFMYISSMSPQEQKDFLENIRIKTEQMENEE